jgi:hypothetical protein
MEGNMPGVIEPDRIDVNDLPGIWSPVQWELSEEDRIVELEEQARASLLMAVDAPETILRLLLRETAITRSLLPPENYDPDEQGEWDEELVTFKFQRPIKLDKEERNPDHLYVELDFDNLGTWAFTIEPERVVIERV